MRKYIILFSVICNLCFVILAFAAPDLATPIRWYVDTDRPAVHAIDLRRGETVNIEPTFRSYGSAIDLSDANTVLFRYKSSDMTNSYYCATGSVYNATAGVCRVRWTAANEPTNSTLFWELAVSGSSSTVVRAYGALKLTASLADNGATNATPRVYSTLDFSTVQLLNIELSPWYTPTNVLSLQAQIRSNDTDIASLQLQTGSNDTDIASIIARIGSNDVDIASAFAQINSNLTDIASANAQIASNDIDIASAFAQISSNHTDITSLQTQITSNLLSIASASSNLSAHISSNNTDIASLNAQIGTNRSDITALTTNLIASTNTVIQQARSYSDNSTQSLFNVNGFVPLAADGNAGGYSWTNTAFNIQIPLYGTNVNNTKIFRAGRTMNVTNSYARSPSGTALIHFVELIGDSTWITNLSINGTPGGIDDPTPIIIEATNWFGWISAATNGVDNTAGIMGIR